MGHIRFRSLGFSLVELLVVLAVAGAMIGLSAGFLSGSLTRSSRFQRECQSLESLLKASQRAARAKVQHRYVAFADLSEQACATGDDVRNGSKFDSKGILVAVFSRIDGLAGFSSRDPRGTWMEETITPRKLRLVESVQHYENLQMAPSLPPPSHGGMLRPAVSRFQRIGHPSGTSALTIRTRTFDREICFRKILHFAPSGKTQVVHQTTADELVHQVEIGLVPIGSPLSKSGSGHASTEDDGADSTGPSTFIAASPQRLQAAIQLCGINGRIKLFLP